MPADSAPTSILATTGGAPSVAADGAGCAELEASPLPREQEEREETKDVEKEEGEKEEFQERDDEKHVEEGRLHKTGADSRDIAGDSEGCALTRTCSVREGPWLQQPQGVLQRTLLPVAQFQRIGRTSALSSPLQLHEGGPVFTHARVLRREEAVASLLLTLSASAGDPPAYEMRLDVCWQDLAVDAAAMGLLRIMNKLWGRAGIHVCGTLVEVCTYAIEPLGLGASLVEVVPHSVTLGALKRTYMKGDAAERVADFLGYETGRLHRLAASTAALLASSYLLGTVAGNGDNIKLTAEGVIFRVDFSHVFGGNQALGSLCPAVWLPRAVTAALGSRWPAVRGAALAAFRAARALLAPTPPRECEAFAPWFQVQATLLRVQLLLSLPVERYSSGLTEQEFAAALQAADRSLGKKLSTLLHDTFGGCRSLRRSGWLSEVAKWSALDIGLFPYAFEEPAPHMDSVTWAAEVDADSWRLALSILACMCRDQETSVRMLEGLLWDHVIAAARSNNVVFRLSVLQVVVGMLRHPENAVRAWLARTAKSASHAESFRETVSRFREHAASLLSQTCAGSSMASADCVALKLGALCALARMDTQGDARYGPEAACSDLAPMAVHEGQVVRRSVIRLAVAMMNSEDPAVRRLLEEAAVHTSGRDLAEAARDLGEDERFSAICAVEGFAKNATVGTRLCTWARRWLTAMAQDQDQDLSRTAVCAIGCAVHDEDPEVQKWARGFLTAAAWDKDRYRSCTPVYAFARMAQVGEPLAMNSEPGGTQSRDEFDFAEASAGVRAVIWEHGAAPAVGTGRSVVAAALGETAEP